MKTRLWFLVSLFLVLGLILAGCGQTRSVTAEEIVARVKETLDSTQDAHAVVYAEVDAQGIQMSVTAEVWEKAPDKLRAEVLESSRPQFVGTLMVTDGQQGWYYEPGRNVVMAGSLGEMETPLPQELLVELQAVIQYVLDASKVELAGRETIAGHDTYKLVLTPKEEGGQGPFPGNGTATLWVDSEQWIVLRAEYQASAFGWGSVDVQRFELNSGLASDLFRFEVPEGATVIDLESQEPVPLTLEEAKAQAGFPLLVPDYAPVGVTLVEVFKTGDADQPAILLRYDHSPDTAFTIVQGLEPAGPPPLGQSQGITVRGQRATLISDEAGGNTFLYWTEGEVYITVAGHIGLDEALKVAESLR
jgi:outer membrane lipoprotein-sorting protein